MPPFKNPLVAVGEALRKDAEIRRRQPLINPSEIKPLEDHLADPASVERLTQLVTDVMSGDAVLATPASRRHSPERAAGRRGAGVGQHQLHVVEPGGRVIDATDRFNARRRNHFNNGSAA